MYIAFTFHVLAATLWVGGLIFAYFFLRPATAQLDTPQRLSLWTAVFTRFFPWVWISILLVIGTGQWMTGYYGGILTVGKYVHLMTGIGYLMTLLFAYVFFIPFRRLKLEVAQSNWGEADLALGRIRMVVAINVVLGIVVLAVASGGKYVI